MQPAHPNGLVLLLEQQPGEADLGQMLDLEDDFVSRGGVAQVDPSSLPVLKLSIRIP
jgi:hypothetical protein